jgi:hypothetical protein
MKMTKEMFVKKAEVIAEKSLNKADAYIKIRELAKKHHIILGLKETLEIANKAEGQG